MMMMMMMRRDRCGCLFLGICLSTIVHVMMYGNDLTKILLVDNNDHDSSNTRSSSRDHDDHTSTNSNNNNNRRRINSIEDTNDDLDSSNSLKTKNNTTSSFVYIPASSEDHVIKNAIKLGYEFDGKNASLACPIWNDENLKPIYDDLQIYLQELDTYNKIINDFDLRKHFPNTTGDIRDHLQYNIDERDDDDDDDEEEEEERRLRQRRRLSRQRDEVCSHLELHPDGLLDGIFNVSKQLSYTSHGYVEPILPPMRHPRFCYDPQGYIMSLRFLVHDFAYICRYNINKSSRTILIDIGASLNFHSNTGDQPAVYLIELYKKFGILFDHIYGYEIRKQEPKNVFNNLIPEDLLSSYHWINVGVNPQPHHKMNPYTMILNKYNENDFIIIKLDVDNNSVELPLAKQLVEDERYSKLIDGFYFEHHVKLKEIAKAWGSSMKGSLKDSIELFQNLRNKGIPSHSWV